MLAWDRTFDFIIIIIRTSVGKAWARPAATKERAKSKKLGKLLMMKMIKIKVKIEFQYDFFNVDLLKKKENRS